MKRGRPQGAKANKTVLLNYRTWIIEYDATAFPSVCYVLKKKGTKNVAYCSTLESALKILYNEMLGDYVNRVNDYGAKFTDLANAISQAKSEIVKALNTPNFDKFIKKDRNENKEEGME